jgi:hypothetical protein
MPGLACSRPSDSGVRMDCDQDAYPGAKTQNGLEFTNHPLRKRGRAAGAENVIRAAQAACWYSWMTPRAPRGASLYSRRSWEELGGMFLGLMAYPDPKGTKGTIACQRSSGRAQAYEARRCGTRVISVKAELPDNPVSRRCNIPSAGKTPVTGAASCVDIGGRSTQPPGCGAMPSEGIQGDERDT